MTARFRKYQQGLRAACQAAVMREGVQAQGGGEIELPPAGVDVGDQGGDRAAFRRGDLLQRIPEGILQRDAGAMAGDAERALALGLHAGSGSLSSPPSLCPSTWRALLARSASARLRSALLRPKLMRFCSAVFSAS